MYKRRKVLLALTEIFDGSLASTDCYKLMFLLCQRANQHYYDYFPYKFGAYSYTLYQDKIRLTQLNYFTESEKFELSGSKKRFIDQVDIDTRKQIYALKDEVGALRGQNLLRKVYLEYPYFATRSLVAKDILSENEYKPISNFKPTDNSQALFTIGYEGMSIDSYLNKLLKYNINLLVDVRKNPISMKYGFSKNQLKKYATSVDISYFHIPDLGIPSHMRRDLKDTREYGNLFQEYLTVMLPQQTSALNSLHQLMAENKRVALTCFEADHCECHRSKITEYLKQDSTFEIPIIHI